MRPAGREKRDGEYLGRPKKKKKKKKNQEDKKTFQYQPLEKRKRAPEKGQQQHSVLGYATMATMTHNDIMIRREGGRKDTRV